MENPLLQVLRGEMPPGINKEVRKLQIKAARYCLTRGVLFKSSYTAPIYGVLADWKLGSFWPKLMEESVERPPEGGP